MRASARPEEAAHGRDQPERAPFLLDGARVQRAEPPRFLGRLEAFASLALRHVTVVPDDDVPPLAVDGLSYLAGGKRSTSALFRANDLHEVSFSARGVTAIVGPSGAGKTILLRAIAGHIPATGAVRLNGLDVSGQQTERRGIVTVFQDFGLFPHLTGLENVAEGAHRLVGRTKSQRLWLAAQQLRELDIEHCAGRLPRLMSGGEQQRVAIARALMAEPDLLLLDEPTAALDQLQRGALHELLRRLRITRPDLPVVLVSHDLDFACLVADRIGVMDEGRLLAFGDPTAVLGRPGSARVAQILGNHNLVAVRLEQDGSFLSHIHLPPLESGDLSEVGTCIALIPHDAVILQPQPDGGNQGAMLTSVASLGAMTRFTLRIGDHLTLTGVTLGRLFPTGLLPGAEVRFAIAQDAVSFVPIEDRREEPWR